MSVGEKLVDIWETFVHYSTISLGSNNSGVRAMLTRRFAFKFCEHNMIYVFSLQCEGI